MKKQWFGYFHFISALLLLIGISFFCFGAFFLYIFYFKEQAFIILAFGGVPLCLGSYFLAMDFFWNRLAYRRLGGLYDSLSFGDQEIFAAEAKRLNHLFKKRQIAFFPGRLGLWMTVSPLPILQLPLLLPYDQIAWAYIWQRNGVLPLVNGNEVVLTVNLPGSDSIYIHDRTGRRFMFRFAGRTAHSKRLLMELQEYAPNAVYGYSKERAKRAKRDFMAFLEEERFFHS